ncbi:MAG: acyl-CoA dehydrogenase family protein [Burkholderiaceae bacterium]
MAKLLASRAAVAAIEVTLQVHGGYGFDRDYDVVTLWPMIRLLEIAPIIVRRASDAQRRHDLPTAPDLLEMLVVAAHADIGHPAQRRDRQHAPAALDEGVLQLAAFAECAGRFPCSVGR